MSDQGDDVSLQDTVEVFADPENVEQDELNSLVSGEPTIFRTATFNEFALTPVQASQGLIDFDKKAGLSLYESGVKALTKPFDGKREHLGMFLDSVWNKIVIMSWQGIIQVDINDEQN